MSTRQCKIFGLFVLPFVLLSALAVQAQVQPTSRVIPFSGTIPGQPDGSVDLRLRLFPVANGGAQCFEETQTVQVVTEAFSVFIGDATTGGIPPSPCFTTNTSLWIAFGLNASPDVEIGVRTAITSSGYAHFAQKVTGLERVQANSPFDTVATKTVQADCPVGKKVVGGGYTFFFGGPTVPIRINIPTLDLGSWLVSTTNLNNTAWSVSAIAICADAG